MTQDALLTSLTLPLWAYVEAIANPQANPQAREIADQDARGVRCKRGNAKQY